MNLFIKKPISQLIESADGGEYRLKRSLGTYNLVSLGIGAIGKRGAGCGPFFRGGSHWLRFCRHVL
jgi:hypothetical protein